MGGLAKTRASIRCPPTGRRADFACFFFNDTATTEIYTLSLHDALPISCFAALGDDVQRSRVDRGLEHFVAEVLRQLDQPVLGQSPVGAVEQLVEDLAIHARSEEHTSELQSLAYLVCRLLLEKKKSYTLI